MKKTAPRSFSQTDAAAWLAPYRSPLFFLAFFWGAQLGRWTEQPWGAITMAVTMPVILWVALATPFVRRTMRLLRGLHRRLPWLEPGVPTWVPEDRAPELVAALAATPDVVVHELDGRTIHSVEDLDVAIAGRFGASRFPADPVRRAITAIASSRSAGRAVHAIVWHHAEQLAQRDPAGFGRLQAAWTKHVGAVARAALFLVAPAPRSDARAPAADAHDVHDVRDGEAVPPQTAPAGAWWKPVPGELSR
jgi:hypothetical protein